jgi:hypothetical protein
MRIAILYICTGKYSQFWEDFYPSAKKNFLNDHQKHFFVFTDDKILLSTHINEVTFLSQNKLGWPYDTLYRYRTFLRVSEELMKFDYVYFLNANALIVDTIGNEIFPEKGALIGSQHPCYFDKNPHEFVYDRNPDSLAFIEDGIGKDYVMGAFIGGDSKAFIKMCEELCQNIDNDMANGIVALWHDESHYNKFLLNHPYKLLSPSYVYPEEMNLPFNKKILLRDKSKFGGHDHLRGIKKSTDLFKIVKKSLNSIFNR